MQKPCIYAGLQDCELKKARSGPVVLCKLISGILLNFEGKAGWIGQFIGQFERADPLKFSLGIDRICR